MSIPKEPGCYILNHIATGNFYIGSAVNLYERYHVHLAHLRKGIHKNRQLQHLYDQDDDIHMEFVTSNDREEAYDIEQNELDIYISHPKCLNVRGDARNGLAPGPALDAWNAATSERNRILHAGNTYMLGKRHSEQTKQLMRERALSRDPSVYLNRPPVSDETRAKLRDSASRPRAKGWKNSPEALVSKRAASVERGIAHSRKVTIDGITYHNATYAANAIGVSRRTVIVRIADDRYPGWSYALALN